MLTLSNLEARRVRRRRGQPLGDGHHRGQRREHRRDAGAGRLDNDGHERAARPAPCSASHGDRGGRRPYLAGSRYAPEQQPLPYPAPQARARRSRARGLRGVRLHHRPHLCRQRGDGGGALRLRRQSREGRPRIPRTDVGDRQGAHACGYDGQRHRG